MQSTSPIQHVDSSRLAEDLMYRFNYVKSFVEFGDADVRVLKSQAHLIAPLVPHIVDAVYVKLFSYDITKAVFLPRNEGFRGAVATDVNSLSLQSEQIAFRKDFLSRYLVKLVTGNYDQDFVIYLDWVGRIHTSTPEKKSKINVDYIHVNALFGWLHAFLVNHLSTLPDLQRDPALLATLLSAFSKLLWIQNDLFARYYVKDATGHKPLAAKRADGGKLQQFKDTAFWITSPVVNLVKSVFSRCFRSD